MEGDDASNINVMRVGIQIICSTLARVDEKLKRIRFLLIAGQSCFDLQLS